MSNFSDIYELYLRGYCGFETGANSGKGYPSTERLCQALALGVYHRVSQKPPLMQSVAVVAELKKMRTPTKPPQTHFDVVLTAVPNNEVIPTIKAVREYTTLGLREAKELVDRSRGMFYLSYEDREAGKFQPAQPQIVLAHIDRAKADVVAKALREVGCTVEIR